MAVKVKKINEEGKEIVKEIDDALYSSYIATGWKDAKDNKKTVIISKPIEKEEKNGKDL